MRCLGDARILVDHLRGIDGKRGGSQIEIPLEKANAARQPLDRLPVALDQAMTRLGEIRPRYLPEIVRRMRFLAGLTVEETADVLVCRTPPLSASGISPACGGVNWS